MKEIKMPNNKPVAIPISGKTEGTSIRVYLISAILIFLPIIVLMLLVR